MDLFEKGWVCPKCGAVMSPTTSCCINCRGMSETSVATDVTTVDVDWVQRISKTADIPLDYLGRDNGGVN